MKMMDELNVRQGGCLREDPAAIEAPEASICKEELRGANSELHPRAASPLASGSSMGNAIWRARGRLLGVIARGRGGRAPARGGRGRAGRASIEGGKLRWVLYRAQCC